MRFGPWEILLIAFVIIVLFGAKRIPELMRSLGSGIKEFKTGLSEAEQDAHKEEGKSGEKGK